MESSGFLSDTVRDLALLGLALAVTQFVISYLGQQREVRTSLSTATRYRHKKYFKLEMITQALRDLYEEDDVSRGMVQILVALTLLVPIAVIAAYHSPDWLIVLLIFFLFPACIVKLMLKGAVIGHIDQWMESKLENERDRRIWKRGLVAAGLVVFIGSLYAVTTLNWEGSWIATTLVIEFGEGMLISIILIAIVLTSSIIDFQKRQ